MDKETQKKLLELVKKNYGEIAEEFDATRKKYLWPELLKLAGMVKDGDRVLDAGCGNGRLAGALSDKNIYYLGVDSSEELVEIAKKNALREIASSPSTAPRNDKYVVGDILELDKIQEKYFDYVFCIAVLHHLPGQDLRIKALEQMKGKLKNNGRIILTVWNLWSQKKFRQLIFKTFLEKILLNLGLMSRRPDVSIGIPTKSSELGRDPDFALRTSGDFGDILFDWKNAGGEKISRRYYHAFSKKSLKKLAGRAGFKIKKLYKDKYNYYLILGK